MAQALLTIVATAISVWLLTRKSAVAFLAGIVTATLLGWALGLVKAPDKLFSAPDFKTARVNALASAALAPLFCYEPV